MDRRSITSRQNARLGGRRTGSKNKSTLEREAVLERIKQRVFAATDVLINAQLSIAQGVSYLYRVERDQDGKFSGKPVLVTDREEIEDYLAGDDNGDYRYITTERPDNKAINSLFDRAYGKAQQNVDVTSGGKTLADLMREVTQPQASKKTKDKKKKK